MFDAISGASWRVFRFNDGAPLGAGQSSDRLYVSFDRDAVTAGALLNLSITPASGMGGTFGVSGADLLDPAAARELTLSGGTVAFAVRAADGSAISVNFLDDAGAFRNNGRA